MFKRIYKLDIRGLEFWQKGMDTESNNFQEVYKKEICVEGSLILDKIGNLKGMPKTSGSYYMNLVTGRVISIEPLEDGQNLIIYPSGIVVSKERFVKYEGNPYLEAAEILDDSDKLDAYTKVSEEILYESYFCNELAAREGLDKIPATMVEEVICERRKGVKEDGYKLLKVAHVSEE